MLRSRRRRNSRWIAWRVGDGLFYDCLCVAACSLSFFLPFFLSCDHARELLRGDRWILFFFSSLFQQSLLVSWQSVNSRGRHQSSRRRLTTILAVWIGRWICYFTQSLIIWKVLTLVASGRLFPREWDNEKYEARASEDLSWFLLFFSSLCFALFTKVATLLWLSWKLLTWSPLWSEISEDPNWLPLLFWCVFFFFFFHDEHLRCFDYSETLNLASIRRFLSPILR